MSVVLIEKSSANTFAFSFTIAGREFTDKILESIKRESDVSDAKFAPEGQARIEVIAKPGRLQQAVTAAVFQLRLRTNSSFRTNSQEIASFFTDLFVKVKLV